MPSPSFQECSLRYRDDAVSRRRIDVLECQRGDGTFPDSFCGCSGHRKMVGTSKTDTKTWNDTPSGSIISQLGAGAVRTDSIWEMSDKE